MARRSSGRAGTLLLCNPAWFVPRLAVEPRAHGARLSTRTEAPTEPADRFDARSASTQNVFSILCLWDDMSSGAEAEDARDRAGVLDDGDHARPGSVRLKSRRNLSYTSLTVTVRPSAFTRWSLFGPGVRMIVLVPTFGDVTSWATKP